MGDQYIDILLLDRFIEETLKEDVGPGDYTSMACIPEDSISTAQLLVKDVGVISGIELAEYFFRKADSEARFTAYHKDGDDVKDGDIAFQVSCNTRALLMTERSILNTMQRMSGISTLASRFAVEVEGMPVTILDTRKTTPGFRFIEKWAVRIGGCSNYRNGLYDWIMIKDNHVDACGGIREAIQKVHEFLAVEGLDLKVTVEVRNLVELHKVLEAGKINRIMFDNFPVPLMHEAVHTVNGRFETEASGGITLGTVRAFASTGVDFISVGSLTHSAGSLDLSLKVIK